jgi:hypothetical protein
MFTASIQRTEKLHFYLEDEVGTSLSNVRKILLHFIIRLHKTLYLLACTYLLCSVEANSTITLGVIHQHYALIIVSLFITQAAKCFGTYVLSSGSVLYPERSAGQSNARNYNIQCTQATNIYSTGVHPDDTTILDFQVTHKDKGRSLKTAHKCRNT